MALKQLRVAIGPVQLVAKHPISAADVRLADISLTSYVADDLCQLKITLSSSQSQLVNVKGAQSALHNHAVSPDSTSRSSSIVGEETSQGQGKTLHR